MSAADVQAIRSDLGRLAQILMTGHPNTVFNVGNHAWLGEAETYSLAKVNAESRLRDAALLAATQGLDTAAVLRRVDERAAELTQRIEQVDENVIAALPGRTDGDLINVLRELLGEARLRHIAELVIGAPTT